MVHAPPPAARGGKGKGREVGDVSPRRPGSGLRLRCPPRPEHREEGNGKSQEGRGKSTEDPGILEIQNQIGSSRVSGIW